jgi:fibronectin-binding autotransporter adhesin
MKKILSWICIYLVTFFSFPIHVYAELDRLALPQGGSVVSGQVDINYAALDQLNVNQSTNQAIVNWQSFNVGRDASVHFNQPGSKASILNNVLSGQSIINGKIFSNGRLFLVNPTGILTGPHSAIKAEGAILSTLNLTNQNFLNNNYQFNTNSNSSLVNQGLIEGQYVALISPQVNNKGNIITSAATTITAGDDVLLGISDSNNLTVKVAPSKLKAMAENEGTIKTQNGMVTINSNAAQSLVDEVVKLPNAKADRLVSENGVIKLVSNSGSIQANKIKIDAASKGATEISGTLNSDNKEGKGGNIEITGKDIDVNSATISADGKTGGGKVLIGGDWQGTGDLLQATYLDVDANSKITANALTSGAGGTIVAWSDIKNSNSLTRVSGTLQAKGIDGSGGQIETSGADLDINGIKIDTSSVTGSYGNWLVDPTDLTIDASAASTYASNLASSDVTLTADNTITLDSNISYSGARDSTLTFNATTTVLNANVTSSNGSLSLDINTILEIGATNTTFTTNGGNVDISGVIRAVSGENSNNFTINAGTGNVTFSSNVVKQVGDYSAGFAQGNFTSISDLDFSGTFLNAINIAGTATTIGDVTFQDGRASNNTLNANESFQNEIQNWNSRDYGDTGLNNIMKGIRWSGGTGHSPYVQFTNATAGQKYKIQALFKEQNYNRYFDVYVDGTKIVDDFRPLDAGSTSVNRGRYLTYQFEAASTNVMFRLSGRTAENSGERLHNNDVNPILNAISIEAVDAGAAINNLSITANQFTAQAIEVSGDLTVTNSGGSTISGVISGDTALVKAGTSSLTISANNTYTGGTTVSAGTLFGGAASRSNSVFGTGSISVASGATLWVDRSDDGALTNALTLNGGTLRGTNGFGQYWDGNITLGAHSIIKADNNFIIDGVISGSSKNLTKTGTGSVILRGTNTYSGTTTISAGTLNISGSGSLGSGTYAGAISNSGTFTYASSAAQTLSGVISGSGALTKSGSSTLTLSGTNTYSGITRVNSGTLSISSLSNLGNSTATLAGGTLKTTSSITTGNGTVINLDGDSSVEVGSGTFNLKGKFLGNGRLTKTGSGTLTLGNSSQNNNWSGGLTINEGKVIALKDRAFGAIPDNFDSDNIILENGSSIDFGTVSFTFNSNRGISLADSGSNSSFIVGKSKIISIPGAISGDGGLTKTGQGVLDIQGANTYTGDTAVNNGNLK